jgi:hypothetical protein
MTATILANKFNSGVATTARHVGNLVELVACVQIMHSILSTEREH